MVQHIYEGEGSPYDLNIHAPVGTHYVNLLDPGQLWQSTWHDPHEPYTEWALFQQTWPPYVTSGGYSVDGHVDGWGAINVDVVLLGGEFMIGETSKELYCNEGLDRVVVDGVAWWRYSNAMPFRVQMSIGSGGEAIVMITSVHQQIPAA